MSSTGQNKNESSSIPSKSVKKSIKRNVNVSKRWQVWQGREDADMLIEKQSFWHCKPEGDDDFGSDD